MFKLVESCFSLVSPSLNVGFGHVVFEVILLGSVAVCKLRCRSFGDW